MMYNTSSRHTCHNKQQLFKSMSLSVNTVADHVNDQAANIQYQPKEKSTDFAAHVIETNKSTDITHILQLAPFILRCPGGLPVCKGAFVNWSLKKKMHADKIFSELLTIFSTALGKKWFGLLVTGP